MKITEELINRFFEGNCSNAEVEAIVHYFNENNKELDNYFIKKEWDTISPDGMPEHGISEITLEKLKRFLFSVRTRRAGSIPLKRAYWLAAASVVIILGVSLFVNELSKGKSIYKPVAEINKNDLHKDSPEQSATKWQVKTNTSYPAEKVTLQDGSIITIYKNSSVRFPVPFRNNKREIILTGDAFFEVAKDKEKPFTVYSGLLSTTALGTSFRVTVFDSAKKNIRVKLFTGRVIVKPADKLINWGKDVVLQPGEQVNYDGTKTDALAIVSKFNNPAGERPLPNLPPEKRGTGNKDVSFHNASLPDVLNQLEDLFDVKINYSKMEIGKINFTGIVKRSDELEVILNAIAAMNGLEIKKSPDGFTVLKSR